MGASFSPPSLSFPLLSTGWLAGRQGERKTTASGWVASPSRCLPVCSMYVGICVLSVAAYPGISTHAQTHLFMHSLPSHPKFVVCVCVCFLTWDPPSYTSLSPCSSLREERNCIAEIREFTCVRKRKKVAFAPFSSSSSCSSFFSPPASFSPCSS